MESFRDILFYVASIAVIVVATTIVIGAYFVFRLVRRVEELIGSIRGEVEHLRTRRRNIEVRGKTAGKFLKMAGLLLLRRGLF